MDKLTQIAFTWCLRNEVYFAPVRLNTASEKYIIAFTKNGDETIGNKEYLGKKVYEKIYDLYRDIYYKNNPKLARLIEKLGVKTNRMIKGTIEYNSNRDKVFLPELPNDLFIGVLKPNQMTIDEYGLKIKKELIETKENDIVIAEIDYYNGNCKVKEKYKE